MKKMMTALLAGALSVSWAHAQPVAPSVDLTKADPALWVVKDRDTTIYLFGTVHVLRQGTVWFDDDIKAAFDTSDELVIEMVEPEPAEMGKIIGEIAVDPDGPPLSQKLSEETRTQYQAAMTANGIPWQAFEPLEPWLAGITLSVAPLAKMGYSAEAGAEKVLTGAAKAANKPVSGLETVHEQLGFFDTLPEKDQIAFLTSTVDSLPKMESEFAKLIDSWAIGEPDALAKQMNESLETTPELAEVLLYKRNANWAQWIKARMAKPGTVFVAVGAGHLAGEKSVQDALKALKIKAKRTRKIGKVDYARN